MKPVFAAAARCGWGIGNGPGKAALEAVRQRRMVVSLTPGAAESPATRAELARI